MKKLLFILAFVLTLQGCEVLKEQKSGGTLVSSLVRITTDVALKDFFGADYIVSKDTLKLSKEVHYKKIERWLGEPLLTKLTYKGEFSIETITDKISLQWKYNIGNQKVLLTLEKLRFR